MSSTETDEFDINDLTPDAHRIFQTKR